MPAFGASEWDRTDIEHLIAQDELAQLFRSPPYLNMVVEIVSSEAFQRLKDVRFLGAIDYLFSPQASARRRRHNRFEHSLQVGRLAREFALRSRLALDQEKHLVVASLLHDIGHAPLSHSLEPIFRDRFHLAHHETSELIISGSVPIGVSMPKIFRKYGIDRRHVFDLIEGSVVERHGEALSNPINIDTIEAITRSYGYITTDAMYPKSLDVLDAMVRAAPEDKQVLDRFWSMKDLVYDQLITSKFGVIADLICLEYLNQYRPTLWGGTVFETETTFRKEHPVLFESLRRFRDTPGPLLSGDAITFEFEKRRFYVDHAVIIEGQDSLRRRYRQTKNTERMRIGDIGSLLAESAKAIRLASASSRRTRK